VGARSACSVKDGPALLEPTASRYRATDPSNRSSRRPSLRSADQRDGTDRRQTPHRRLARARRVGVEIDSDLELSSRRALAGRARRCSTFPSRAFRTFAQSRCATVRPRTRTINTNATTARARSTREKRREPRSIRAGEWKAPARAQSPPCPAWRQAPNDGRGGDSRWWTSRPCPNQDDRPSVEVAARSRAPGLERSGLWTRSRAWARSLATPASSAAFWEESWTGSASRPSCCCS
jgi:hypothetical protein